GVDELTNDFHRSALAGAGGDTWSTHEIDALFLGQRPDHKLELRIGEYPGKREDAGRRKCQLAGSDPGEKTINGVRSDGRVSGTVTASHGDRAYNSTTR